MASYADAGPRKLRDPEELVVRGQLRYLVDVLAELRRQPGRGFIDATGPLEHVCENNTRFSAHLLLDFGGPVSARGPVGGPGLVLHQRMARPKDLGVCSEGRHRASPELLSSREVRGAARLQPAPAAMSSLPRTRLNADQDTSAPSEACRSTHQRPITSLVRPHGAICAIPPGHCGLDRAPRRRAWQ